MQPLRPRSWPNGGAVMAHRNSLYSCVAFMAVKMHWAEEAIKSMPLRRLYKYLELMNVA